MMKLNLEEEYLSLLFLNTFKFNIFKLGLFIMFSVGDLEVSQIGRLFCL